MSKQSEPTTFERRVRRLERECSESDWDNEGAPALPGSLWQYALNVYAETRDLGEPFVSPGDGTVRLSWESADRHLSVELTDGDAFVDEASPPSAGYQHRRLARSSVIGELRKLLDRNSKDP